MIRLAFKWGVLYLGIPAGLVSGVLVSVFTDRDLAETLAISLPVFAVMGFMLGLGRAARAITSGREPRSGDPGGGDPGSRE